MRILLDTNVPAPLGRAFIGHEVIRTGELGWQRLENGALLDAAEGAGLDVLVTCDQNLLYQQNFSKGNLAVMVLSTNHWPTIQPIAARIGAKIEFVQRGQIMRIDVSSF